VDPTINIREKNIIYCIPRGLML